MLKLLEYDSASFESGIVLEGAYDVVVSREINGEHRLEFAYPVDGKSRLIQENKIVVCSSQAYRIMRVCKSSGEKNVMKVQCEHIYNADAVNIHLQNVPDMIGVSPKDVLEYVFSGTKFSLLSDSALAGLGMKRVDSDGFLIDFFSVDKTNPFEVVKSVIESCGKGELYVDNCKIALVERIGRDTNIRLDVTKNMADINVERDITDMVTVLYPYGKDDAHIGSVNGGAQYIRSANADVYGEREGYRDYSDYMEPGTIMRRALWEFDSENKDRLDVPSVNITGSFADIARLSEYGDKERVELGDGVTVIDGENEIYERVIRLEYYPYQSNETVITIGRVRRDLFFYLDQMGTLAKRYSKVSMAGGKVRAQAVAGVISNSGITVKSDTGALSILSDLLQITTDGKVRARIGNKDGAFVCRITDGSGKNAVDIGADGQMNFTAGQVSIGGNVITAGADGDLCINGRKIVCGESGGDIGG